MVVSHSARSGPLDAVSARPPPEVQVRAAGSADVVAQYELPEGIVQRERATQQDRGHLHRQAAVGGVGRNGQATGLMGGDAGAAHAEVLRNTVLELAVVAHQHITPRSQHLEAAIAIVATDAVTVLIEHSEFIAALGKTNDLRFHVTLREVAIWAARGHHGTRIRGQLPGGLAPIVVQCDAYGGLHPRRGHQDVLGARVARGVLVRQADRC